MNPEEPQLASVTDLTSYRNRNKVQNDVFRPDRRVGALPSERPTQQDLELNEKKHLARKRAAANPDLVPSAITRTKDKVTRVVDHLTLAADHALGAHSEEQHPHCADCRFPDAGTRAVDGRTYS
jgi:hypothetical protein